MISWESFLSLWSRQLLSTNLAHSLNPQPTIPHWLGFAPATLADITNLETRLGMLLPPSYKSFLITTNGFRRTTFAINHIRSAAEVNWFQTENEAWIETYADQTSDLPDHEYYDYEKNSGLHFRPKHLQSLVQISDVDDGVYLLNPTAITPDGEWEAWFFADWIPGAHRYPSFMHLMLAEYKSFTITEKIDAAEFPSISTYPPEIPRISAKRLLKRKPQPPSVESLILQMQSTDTVVRSKAVQTLFGNQKLRSQAIRRPDLIQSLCNLFYSSTDPNVRSACVAKLSEIAIDPPSPFLDALSDSNPSVVLQGIFTLSYFPNPLAVDPLCKFIDSKTNPLYNENAMNALGEIGSPAAIPTLTGVLLNIENTFEQNFATAAIALSRCGPLAVNALINSVGHLDPRVRLAVAIGLDSSGDPRAGPYLDQLQTDPDPNVRNRAKIRAGKPNW